MTPTEQARAVVEALERIWKWGLRPSAGLDGSLERICGICGERKADGHMGDCEVGAALSAARSLLQGLEREQGEAARAVAILKRLVYAIENHLPATRLLVLGEANALLNERAAPPAERLTGRTG